MTHETYVSCHAPSLSFLLFETVRSVHNQKGLLIGQIVNEVISKKTDDNEVNHEQKTGIYIEHCIAVDDTELFGNVGDINKSCLKKYLDRYDNKIIGWYSFRRNTKIMQYTMRELLIHKSLLSMVPHARSDQFIVALMSASVDQKGSTHTYHHIFLRFQPRADSFEALKLKIYTLSDKSVNSNGYTTKSCFPTARKFDQIINSVNKDEKPVKSVLGIHQQVSKLLDMYNMELQESENMRTKLQEEINSLKRALGIDDKDITVTDEDERVLPDLNYTRFSPHFRYNPNRKCPFDGLEFKQIPSVPEDDDDDDNHDNEDKEEQSVKEPLPEVTRTYSRALSTTVKTPKMRVGLGPISSPSGNRRSNANKQNSSDFRCENDGTSEKSAIKHVSQLHENSMEY